MITLNQVGKKFVDGKNERWVIRNLSKTLRLGEFVAICGPSGSGKTTLLNLLAGLLRPDHGEIRVAFEDEEHYTLNELNERQLLNYRRSAIGYVYQFFNLIPTLTLEENVLLPLELTRRNNLKDHAIDRVHTLGIAGRLSAFPHELSGGEQQRAAIARALAHHPKIVFADEPTGNLDAGNSSEVIKMLRDEVKSLDTILVVATHSEEFRELADSVIDL